MDRIKVLLVDDDISWQGAIGRFLNRERSILLTGMVKTREEAVAFVKTIEVDVVLMDINLTENRLDGIEAAIEIKGICNAKIIMLTSMKGEEVIMDSFTAGAVNFISKEEYKVLPEIIKLAYKKSNPVELLVSEYNKLKKLEQLKDLSDCEKEVYSLMEEGVSRQQMQLKLNKSENTIKKYIRQVLRKLDVRSSKEAVKKVNRKGLEEKKIKRGV